MSILKKIKNIIFDEVCVICSSRDLSDEFSFICKECLDNFLTPSGNDNEVGQVCNICKHPLLEDGKCPSCKLIKPIYYDNYFLYHYYGEFFKFVVVLWKKQEYFNIINLFLKMITSDSRIDKEIPLTIIPDNFLGRMKKGRVSLHWLLKKLRKKGYNTIMPLLKKQEIVIKHQKHKSQLERIENISKYYFLPLKNIKKYSGEIYLIDDIYTTGSTLNHGAKLLKEAGFEKVTIISIFRAVISKKS